MQQPRKVSMKLALLLVGAALTIQAPAVEAGLWHKFKRATHKATHAVSSGVSSAVNHTTSVATTVASGAASAGKTVAGGVTSAANTVSGGVNSAVSTVSGGVSTAIKMTPKYAMIAGKEVLVGARYAATYSLYGLKVAHQASYKALTVGANATVKSMVAAGKSIQQAAQATQQNFKNIDSQVKAMTGGLGIVDILGMAFPEVAFVQGLVAVCQDPTDWHGWLQIASSTAGVGIFSGAAGAAFELAANVAQGGLIDNTIKVIKNPSLQNIGNLVISAGSAAAGSTAGKELIETSKTLNTAVKVGKAGYEAYKTGTQVYQEGMALQAAIKQKDWKGALVHTADLGKAVGSNETVQAGASKVAASSVAQRYAKSLAPVAGVAKQTYQAGKQAYGTYQTAKGVVSAAQQGQWDSATSQLVQASVANHPENQ